MVDAWFKFCVFYVFYWDNTFSVSKLNENIPFPLAIQDGQYGYIAAGEDGADTFVPFSPNLDFKQIRVQKASSATAVSTTIVTPNGKSKMYAVVVSITHGVANPPSLEVSGGIIKSNILIASDNVNSEYRIVRAFELDTQEVEAITIKSPMVSGSHAQYLYGGIYYS